MCTPVVQYGRRGERSEDATPGGVLVMASEIADTARLTAELQHSQAYARAVLDSAPDAMVIVDAAGQIQRTNAELERLFGYTREELAGRSAELLIADRRGADRGSRVGIFSLPRVRPAGAWRELVGRRKDGTEFPIEVSVRGFASEPGLATAAIRDVTARKRVEADLRDANVEQLRVLNAELVERLSELETATQEQEQLHVELVEAQAEAAESLMLMQTLLSTAPVGFGFVDRDFRIRHINETLAAINGSSIEDQLGRTLAEVLPDLWPAMEPVYRRVLDTGEAVVNRDLTSENRAWPGGLRAWLASYYPVRAGAETVGVGVVVVDITERRQAEEFRLVVMQNMAEGLVVMDGEGQLMFMNAAASKMLGWSEDELRARPQRPADRPAPRGRHLELQRRAPARCRRTDHSVGRRGGVADDAPRDGLCDRSQRSHQRDHRTAHDEQLDDLLAGIDVRLSDEILDRIDEIVPPGTDLGAPDQSAYLPPALQCSNLRRRPLPERAAA